MKKKWSFSAQSYRPAVWAGRKQISILTKGCQDTVGREAADSKTWTQQIFWDRSISLLIENILTALFSEHLLKLMGFVYACQSILNGQKKQHLHFKNVSAHNNIIQPQR